MKSSVVVRFAPSPTGLLHVGGVRSALFNYLYAKKHGGKILLRIEDTDILRSKKEYEKDILDGFAWLNLSFAETIRQSDRAAVHRTYLQKLIDSGHAYISKEEIKTGEGGEGRRSEVIRFNNPGTVVTFRDLIKGDITFDTKELGDFVIAKSLTEPLFHLAVVVDDFEMGVTHVIRGEDHISNTPRQILIQRAIGALEPQYAHIPLLLATDKTKLSKRKHGESVSLLYYRSRGYEPEALLNYLALLGWNPGTDQELFSLQELINAFTLERVQKSNAIFNVEKLNWLNKEYLKQQDQQTLATRIAKTLTASKRFSKLSPDGIRYLSLICIDRIKVFGEVSELLSSGEFDYLETIPTYAKESLLFKGKGTFDAARTHLQEVARLLSDASLNPSPQDAQNLIMPYAEKEGKGEVLWPLRFALSGKERSIDPWSLIACLGVKESGARIEAAVRLLQ